MKIRLTESQLNYIKEVLGDEIPPYMKDIIQKRYSDSDKFLNKNVPKHTDVIPNVKVEVQDENITNRTIRELIEYFSENIVSEFTKTKLFKLFDARNLNNSDLSNSDKLTNFFEKSLGVSLFTEDWKTTTPEESNNTFKKITWFYSKEFKLPVSSKNDISNPIFSQNKSGISTFLKVSKKVFGDFSILRDINVDEIINDKRFVGLRDPIINYQMNLKKISDSKLFLYISDKPDDKLRMSVSRFYDSCQNIYTGGDSGTQFNKKLLSNVFDKNSKVAYLIFNAPFRDKMGNPHPFTSIARTVLRVNKEGGVMFDRVYPNDMKDLFYKIIEDKTGLKNVGKDGDIYDYKGVDGLPSPYMDRFQIRNVGKGDPSINYDHIQALSTIADINPKELMVISDNTYRIGDQEWSVYTFDEAMELTRDFFGTEYYDLLYDRDMVDIIYNEILRSEDIKEELNIDEDDMKESGYDDFAEYIREVLGIEVLSDLHKAIKNSRNDSSAAHRWLDRHRNIDNIIEYFGGEYESMGYAIASYDGNIEEYQNLIVVRRN